MPALQPLLALTPPEPRHHLSQTIPVPVAVAGTWHLRLGKPSPGAYATLHTLFSSFCSLVA